MRRAPLGFVAVMVIVVSGVLGARALHSDPEHVRPPHVARPDLAGAPGPLPLAVAGADYPGEAIAALEHVAYGAAIGEQQERDRVAERDRMEAARLAATRAAVPAGSGSCAGDVACFLPCTRAHESDTSGGYSAVSSSGTYRGAYQFAQATWDAAVAGAGHDEYAGVPADQVPPEVQDAAAAHLYGVSGTQPWGGRC